MKQNCSKFHSFFPLPPPWIFPKDYARLPRRFVCWTFDAFSLTLFLTTLPTGAHRSPQEPSGLLWAPVGSCGLLWAPVGSCGLLWAPVGSCGSGGLWWAVVSDLPSGPAPAVAPPGPKMWGKRQPKDNRKTTKRQPKDDHSILGRFQVVSITLIGESNVKIQIDENHSKMLHYWNTMNFTFYQQKWLSIYGQPQGKIQWCGTETWT